MLDLYHGPIYVEELDALKRSDITMKVTIGRPGDEVKEDKFSKTNQIKRETLRNKLLSSQSVGGLANLMQ